MDGFCQNVIPLKNSFFFKIMAEVGNFLDSKIDPMVMGG
jgi:hypothetical protein